MKPLSRLELQKAIACLKDGGVVLFPTETSYGLAADATNAKAVAKVARLKGRPEEKTFPLIVSSVTMADRYGHLRCLGQRLAKTYWPGALTLVVEARKGVGLARGVIAKDGTIALRVSSNEVARALARGLGRPIVSTSANLSGEPPLFDVASCKIGADAVLNVGRLPKRAPSTIVSILQGEIQLIRAGSVKPVDPKHL